LFVCLFSSYLAFLILLFSSGLSENRIVVVAAFDSASSRSVPRSRLRLFAGELSVTVNLLPDENGNPPTEAYQTFVDNSQALTSGLFWLFPPVFFFR
jgi:hypothetical protein